MHKTNAAWLLALVKGPGGVCPVGRGLGLLLSSLPVPGFCYQGQSTARVLLSSSGHDDVGSWKQEERKKEPKSWLFHLSQIPGGNISILAYCPDSSHGPCRVLGHVTYYSAMYCALL